MLCRYERTIFKSDKGASAFLPTVLLMSLFQRKPVIGLTTMTTRFISRQLAII